MLLSFIHGVTGISFLWLNNIPLHVYMCAYVCVYICTDTHVYMCICVCVYAHTTHISHFPYPLICGWIIELVPCLGYVNYAAVNMERHRVPIEMTIASPLNACPEAGLLGHTIVLLLIF